MTFVQPDPRTCCCIAATIFGALAAVQNFNAGSICTNPGSCVNNEQ